MRHGRAVAAIYAFLCCCVGFITPASTSPDHAYSKDPYFCDHCHTRSRAPKRPINGCRGARAADRHSPRPCGIPGPPQPQSRGPLGRPVGNRCLSGPHSHRVLAGHHYYRYRSTKTTTVASGAPVDEVVTGTARESRRTNAACSPGLAASRVEMFLQPRPAVDIVVLQARKIRGEPRQALREPGLEHERQRVLKEIAPTGAKWRRSYLYGA